MTRLALALLVLCLTQPGEAAEVRDMLGRRVAVPDRPARIVSLAPSLTESVYAVGAGDRLVGVTDYCDFPPAARGKPKVGGTYSPNLEVILSLHPDLVLATTEANRDEHIRSLEALGTPVYVVRPVSFATVLESVQRVAGVLGREAEGRRLVADMERQAAEVGRAVKGARRPRVLYVVWGDPLVVPGRDILITELIQRAGGESVTADLPFDYPRFSVEEAVARRPELVLLAPHGDESLEQRLREWPLLSLLPAVREGRVHRIDLLHRPGPRTVEALRALARLLHPEVVR
ncbi:MAG TPA: cobalamin-binding protein [Methylomirabilota bacterium]|jgi:iron complex transport system substrate-binding protein|nr:cobalamin-binding protein [Methylomirabilota bacterium]